MPITAPCPFDSCETEFVVEDEDAVREHVEDHLPFEVPETYARGITEDLLAFRALQAETGMT